MRGVIEVLQGGLKAGLVAGWCPTTAPIILVKKIMHISSPDPALPLRSAVAFFHPFPAVATVGWVEQSETHHPAAGVVMGFGYRPYPSYAGLPTTLKSQIPARSAH
jgi:hypothetical protein